VSRVRLALGAAGVLLGMFGLFRLVTQIPGSDLVVLALWLIGAVLIHDGILSPIVVGIGWTVTRIAPPRARRYLQAAIVAAAMVTVIAIPMIYRRDSQPRSKAILQQNYGGNLTLLLAIIAGASLLLYAVRVARDHASATPADPLPDGPDATGPQTVG
jgi:hypothetical protein